MQEHSWCDAAIQIDCVSVSLNTTFKSLQTKALKK